MFDLAGNRAAKMLAHGRVTITFKSPSGKHITVLAKAKAPVNEKWVQVPLAKAKIIWLEVPNPEHGKGVYNDRIGKFTGSKGFVPSEGADPARIYCAKALIAYVRGHAVDGRLEIKVEDKCCICGRQLTDPESIDRGIGPECYGKATASEHQVKGKQVGKKFDFGKNLTADGTSKKAPKKKAKPDVVIPDPEGVCVECGYEGVNVIFGYCDGCHKAYTIEKNAELKYRQGAAEVAQIQAITAPGSELREQMYMEMEMAAYNRGEE